MKKPLLLLVDDDRAVLEALESELAPEFAQVCRIETFDDPCAVLDALPRWREEQREIAVAIVDQKMPRMTGVELLLALREAVAECSSAVHEAPPRVHPARHTHAALLTGYAGLESAIAARNEAGAQRYLEKPWFGRELAGAVRELFGRWMQSANAGTHVVLREVRDEADLETLLRLRYSVYAGTEDLGALLPRDQTDRIDASPYDLVSHHLGLTLRSGKEAEWIGAVRIAGTTASPATDALAAIGRSHPSVGVVLDRPRGEPLPIMNDFPELKPIWESCTARREAAAEPGKLVLHPGHRSSARTGDRHLARFLIEGTVGHFLHYRTPTAILGCNPFHAPFYRPLGFRDAEGAQSQPRPHPRLGFPFVLLHGHMDWIPSPAHERCDAIATRIARTGGACRCSNFPECLGGAYETGDFTTTDMFCPLRATELLEPE